MQYGILNCLSHISNPLETVPSEPITIEMTWIEWQFQIHYFDLVFQVTVFISLLYFLA